jgi:hypothetical protein
LFSESSDLDFLDDPWNVSTAHGVSLGTAYYWIFLRSLYRSGYYALDSVVAV